LSACWPRALPCCSSSDWLDCDEAVPPVAALVPPADALVLPLAWLELLVLPPAAGEELLELVAGAVDVLPEALPEPDDWLVCAPWFMVDDGFVVVALWFADTPLETFWSPVPTFTPGLMLALALMSVLLTPTFASTPTFGLTFTPPEGDVLEPLVLPLDAEGALVVVPLALPEVLVEPEELPEPEDWLVCAPWVVVDDGLVVVALWLADTPLDTFWSPVPRFTPGLTFAPALTSLLLMPTFASTPTFGLTFTPPEGEVVEPLELEGWLLCVVLDCWSVLDVCAFAAPKAAITAAAVILTAKCRALMKDSFLPVVLSRCRKRCATLGWRVGKLPT
jgi:hypothetical protein